MIPNIISWNQFLDLIIKVFRCEWFLPYKNNEKGNLKMFTIKKSQAAVVL